MARTPLGARRPPGASSRAADCRAACVLPGSDPFRTCRAPGDSDRHGQDQAPPGVRQASPRARTHQGLDRMTAHDWYLENRVAFATRTLEPRDESIFANHLSRCEECRAAVAQVEGELAWLPMGVKPVAPRPGVTRKWLERVLYRPRARWWRWAAAIASAAVLALSLGGWTKARREIVELKTALASHRGRLVALTDSLSAILGAERVLQKTI